MSHSAVLCPKNPLPRDLDVEVVISRPMTEIATDMTLICFLTPEADFAPDNGRVRYYSSFADLQADCAPASAMYYAGKAFFERAVRPLTLAVGRVFEDPVPAGLLAGDIRLTDLRVVEDGAFDIEVNGALVSVAGLDFSGCASLAQVAGVVAGAMPLDAGLTVAVEYGGLCLSSVVLGDGATISYAEVPSQGTDVSSLLRLTKESGARLWQGYTPGGIAAEAALVRTASRCNQRLPYAWTLDARYRDTGAQKELADWAEALFPAWFSACTNAPSAYDATDTSNIGFYAMDKGYKRTSTIYHDNGLVYPDLSYAAYALATNYSLPDSAVTMKFKQLDGIEPSPLSETQLSALNARRINCYVYIGNNSRTVREGVQALDSWYTDSLVNLDNFREELQVEVYNVFLRSPKLPYTSAGQDKLVSAAARICRKYTRNGVFADRDVESDRVETGITTLPATNIEPVPVAFATASERASRTAPPILITAYEAGAFHKVSIRVDVYN
ncbi:DUF3383 domain-containing protein [Desulfovibrio sp. OttesenSCG-928-A18]|nr:DUF3383 domain-containing protein [Desulfovibrio sp. OttesenSCG-928-A18]